MALGTACKLWAPSCFEERMWAGWQIRMQLWREWQALPAPVLSKNHSGTWVSGATGRTT